jgi:TATA-binding protein-associated factor Taf7
MSNEVKEKVNDCKRKIRNGTNPMLVAKWMVHLSKLKGEWNE